jgi:RND family efflux transporter MFP subunit
MGLLMAGLVYVFLRAGPMAPIKVTVITVENQAITPEVSGIGTVEARYTYAIGPTVAGRVKSLAVDVGDHVKAGQRLGEMDSVDLDARIASLTASIERAKALRQDATARLNLAQSQLQRYQKLAPQHLTSEESLAIKQQELLTAQAARQAADLDIERLQADRLSLTIQKSNLLLIAPVDGLVVARDAEPGSTVVAGQAVIELIDPLHLWINARIAQNQMHGLVTGLPATIQLRSGLNQLLQGTLMRIEPKADSVTEETQVKIRFTQAITPLPPVGELASITIQLPRLPASPTIPNASIHNVNGQMGVWQIKNNALEFTPITLGAMNLAGAVQVLSGLNVGDKIVVYSERNLHAKARIRIADTLIKNSSEPSAP